MKKSGLFSIIGLVVFGAGCELLTQPEPQPLTPAPTIQSRIVESGRLQPEPGFEDPRVGARIETVETDPETQQLRVGVSLPGHEDIEEITVLGSASDASPIEQPSKIERFNDPDKSGLVIYLPNSQDFVLRLNYFDENNPTKQPGSPSDLN